MIAGIARARAVLRGRAALLVFAGLAACSHGGPPLRGTALPQAAAPDFTLTDQNSHDFALHAQHGKVVVLFFGYTHCADVCPTTLATLARIEKRLGERRDRVEVAFVTVDPERDTPAVIKPYLRLFDARFVGLTAPAARLDPVLDAYKVWHQRLPRKGPGEDEMAHGSTIYLIDPQGKLRTIHDYADAPSDIASDIEVLAT